MPGTLSFSVVAGGNPQNIYCYWLIQAPKNKVKKKLIFNCSLQFILRFFIKQRVYLEFTNVNVEPTAKTGGCSTNYISVASSSKPTDSYKVCGQRESVKLVTTYNSVLIGFVMKSMTQMKFDFGLAYKILGDSEPGNLIFKKK